MPVSREHSHDKYNILNILQNCYKSSEWLLRCDASKPITNLTAEIARKHPTKTNYGTVLIHCQHILRTSRSVVGLTQPGRLSFLFTCAGTVHVPTSGITSPTQESRRHFRHHATTCADSLSFRDCTFQSLLNSYRSIMCWHIYSHLLNHIRSI